MIRHVCWSGPGGHVENQDAFLVGCQRGDPEERLACAVADGQGGRSGAARAAQVACQTFMDQAEACDSALLIAPANWLTWLLMVDEAVRTDPTAGYCAFVALAVSETQVVGASCGDCAALAYSAGRKPAVLTDRQSKNPPVGSGMARFTPFALSLTPPWTVLLCSDGVWKYGGWDALMALDPLQPGEEIIASLRQRATLPRTGELQDDFTLVVLQQGEGAAP